MESQKQKGSFRRAVSSKKNANLGPWSCLRAPSLWGWGQAQLERRLRLCSAIGFASLGATTPVPVLSGQKAMASSISIRRGRSVVLERLDMLKWQPCERWSIHSSRAGPVIACACQLVAEAPERHTAGAETRVAPLLSNSQPHLHVSQLGYHEPCVNEAAVSTARLPSWEELSSFAREECVQGTGDNCCGLDSYVMPRRNFLNDDVTKPDQTRTVYKTHQSDCCSSAPPI